MNEKRLVQVFGVFVVIIAMLGYMIGSVYALESYKLGWYGLNASQVHNCNQTTWNAMATSSYMLSKQWLAPLEDISGQVYPLCKNYTIAAHKGRLTVPS